jgi:hypothetical protein
LTRERSNATAESPTKYERCTTIIAAIVVLAGIAAFIFGLFIDIYAIYVALALLLVAGFLYWMYGIVRNSSTTARHLGNTAYMVCVGVVSLAPIAAVALAIGRVTTGSANIGSGAFTSAIGAVTVLMIAFYTAALESDVSGWRKDALKFALAMTTIVGAAVTAFSALVGLGTLSA